MTKQQLASRIWESANKMRNKIEASEYKDYILGLIFYRFLSDEEVKWLKTELGCSDKDIKDALSDQTTIDQVKSSLGYYISYKDLFTTWFKKQNFSIKDVSNALRSIAFIFRKIIVSSFFLLIFIILNRRKRSIKR